MYYEVIKGIKKYIGKNLKSFQLNVLDILKSTPKCPIILKIRLKNVLNILQIIHKLFLIGLAMLPKIRNLHHRP